MPYSVAATALRTIVECDSLKLIHKSRHTVVRMCQVRHRLAPKTEGPTPQMSAVMRRDPTTFDPAVYTYVFTFRVMNPTSKSFEFRAGISYKM